MGQTRYVGRLFKTMFERRPGLRRAKKPMRDKSKRLFYFVFYWLYLFLADSPVQVDSGDFCVMSRRAIQLLLSLPEKLRFVRGLRAWLGLPAKAVSRFAGGTCRWRSAVFIQKTAKASFLRTHVLFNKAIEGRTLMRQPALPRRDCHRVDLCRDCSMTK